MIKENLVSRRKMPLAPGADKRTAHFGYKITAFGKDYLKKKKTQKRP
jgi:hypothetical protein